MRYFEVGDRVRVIENSNGISIHQMNNPTTLRQNSIYYIVGKHPLFGYYLSGSQTGIVRDVRRADWQFLELVEAANPAVPANIVTVYKVGGRIKRVEVV